MCIHSALLKSTLKGRALVTYLFTNRTRQIFLCHVKTFSFFQKVLLLQTFQETHSPVLTKSSFFTVKKKLFNKQEVCAKRPETIISRKMSEETDVESKDSELVQRFLDCAARGDVENFEQLLGAVDIDVKSDRGWTALMFAARNGHTSVINILVQKGCDVNCLNASGQTALEIAQFWNHKEVASILSQYRQQLEYDQIHNYYSLNPLYRASDVRKDAKQLESAKNNKSAKFIMFSKLQPFLITSEEKKRNLNQLPSSIRETSTLIFLGLETWDPVSSPWFAVDLVEGDHSFISKYYPDGSFVAPFPTTMQMIQSHAGLFAEAHSILCWLDKYRFCPTCGSKQTVIEGGYKQVCNNSDCTSHKGVHNTCYPRVDPSLIMLVLSPSKKQCLLGRQKRFPPKMFSCLAGFMEPGESIEDTCRREIEEESGVKVGRVDYHSSQPWPFPATLMLGCIAHARTETITIDKDELEEARWFSRAEIAQMLAGQHPDGLFIPPSQAIAHQLIKSWATSNSANL
uniref:NAD-capped RNA hydrolase NUDT12 n=1 Tax=Biomphalaria glabrata TaxID=6526 RepID=A0A2C9LAL5_BIOGL